MVIGKFFVYHKHPNDKVNLSSRFNSILFLSWIEFLTTLEVRLLSVLIWVDPFRTVKFT